MKTKLFIGKFCINMHQIWKKEQSDDCRLIAKKKQYSNLEYHVPDPTFSNSCELNNVNTEIG